jgi:hypothetical protein
MVVKMARLRSMSLKVGTIRQLSPNVVPLAFMERCFSVIVVSRRRRIVTLRGGGKSLVISVPTVCTLEMSMGQIICVVHVKEVSKLK